MIHILFLQYNYVVIKNKSFIKCFYVRAVAQVTFLNVLFRLIGKVAFHYCVCVGRMNK